MIRLTSMKMKLQILIATLMLVLLAGWIRGQQDAVKSAAISTLGSAEGWPTNNFGLASNTVVYGAGFAITNMDNFDAKTVLAIMKERGTLTNLLNEAVASGEFCRIRGHRWEPGCGMEGCAVNHYGPTRHCAVCGLMQTQEPGEWK